MQRNHLEWSSVGLPERAPPLLTETLPIHAGLCVCVWVCVCVCWSVCLSVYIWFECTHSIQYKRTHNKNNKINMHHFVGVVNMSDLVLAGPIN